MNPELCIMTRLNEMFGGGKILNQGVLMDMMRIIALILTECCSEAESNRSGIISLIDEFIEKHKNFSSEGFENEDEATLCSQTKCCCTLEENGENSQNVQLIDNDVNDAEGDSSENDVNDAEGDNSENVILIDNDVVEYNTHADGCDEVDCVVVGVADGNSDSEQTVAQK